MTIEKFTKKIGKILRNCTMIVSQESDSISIIFKGYQVIIIKNSGSHLLNSLRIKVKRKGNWANPWLLNIGACNGIGHFYDILRLLDKFFDCLNYLEEKKYLCEEEDYYYWKASFNSEPRYPEEESVSLILGHEIVFSLSYKKKVFNARTWTLNIGNKVAENFKEKDLREVYSTFDNNFWCRDMTEKDFINNVLSKIPSYISEKEGKIGQVGWRVLDGMVGPALMITFEGGYQRGYEDEVMHEEIILEKRGLGDLAHILPGTLRKIILFDWLMRLLPRLDPPGVGYMFSAEKVKTVDSYRGLSIRNDSPGQTGWLYVMISEEPTDLRERKIFVTKGNYIRGVTGFPEDTIQVDLDEDIKITKEKIIKKFCL